MLAARPHEPIPLAAIARYLDVSKATCLPMLNALVGCGWLVRHPDRRTYRLGPALVEIGLAAQRAAPGDAQGDNLRDLAAATEACVIVWQPSDDHLVLTEIFGPNGQLPQWSGLTRGHPIKALAPLASALVAWTDPDTINRWIDRPHPTDLPTTRARLVSALSLVRQRGFAIERAMPAIHEVFQLVEHTRVGGSDGLEPVVRSIEVRRQQELVDSDYLVGELDPAEHYDLVSINAPVFGPFGEVEQIVCVVDPPPALDADEVMRIGGLVRQLTEACTHHGGGVQPAFSAVLA